MRMSMVSHFMSGLIGRLDQGGMSPGTFTNHKERNFCLVFGQQLENARRVVRIWSVVDRQPDLPLRGRKITTRANESLRARDEQMIGQQAVGQKPARRRGPRIRPPEPKRNQFAEQ